MTPSTRDAIYREPLSAVGDFRFDAVVADVFADMISRSVPGYCTVLAMVPALAKRFITPNSHVYDLGCSLGAASLAIAKSGSNRCQIFAVDNSPAMIDRLNQQLQINQSTHLDLSSQPNDPSRQHDPVSPPHRIITQNQDIGETEIVNASFVVLNYTLQFIAPEKRGEMLQKIYDGMIQGGAMLMSEKIHLHDQSGADLLVELHHDFKRAQGYSDLEISQKRTALEKTLVTETMAAHTERLETTGFRTIVPWFVCLGFASFLAIK